MKLAEALNQRADLRTRISQLGERLNVNAKVQEGDKPSEDPALLLAELEENIRLTEELISRINRTNSATLDKGESITDLIARRDALTLKNSILRSFLSAASDRADRYSLKEIRIVSTVDVAALQKTVDKNARALRELDTRLQMLNWTTELL